MGRERCFPLPMNGILRGSPDSLLRLVSYLVPEGHSRRAAVSSWQKQRSVRDKSVVDASAPLFQYVQAVLPLFLVDDDS